MKKGIVAIAAAMLITGCATSGDPSGAEASKKARTDSKNVESLTSNKEVYLSDFRVTFITEDSSSAKSTNPLLFRGGDGNDYATAILRAKLTGIDEATLQSITDKAYADFLANMQERGYTVLDQSGLEAIKAWNKIDTLSSPNPPFDPASKDIGEKAMFSANNARQITFAPAGMPLLKLSSNNQVPYNYGVAADKAGKPIVRAHYVVHFAYFGSDTDYDIDYNAVDMAGRDVKRTTLSASVSLGQGIQVTPGSAIEFSVDQGGTFSKGGYISLKDPVVIGGNYGTNLDTTSSTTKAVNAFSSLLGQFSGGSSSTKEVSIEANPAYYAYGVESALSEANKRLFNNL